jgi:predicted Ser/Thr protein kinase
MIAPGTVLQNRYVVERQIGEGGMGAVYIATDQRFGSTVALKETFFDDPNLRKAFEREARLLNHLRHTALPRVSDHFGEEEGQFLVMEYIPGEDLSHMLKARGKPFAVRDVLAWADQLLDALEYLHTQTPSVVHRDIKPQNLKLLPRNQIVLLDFGLAKGTPLQTRVTATGSVFGYSFNYAPLEQMQGAGTDPRSDLYSLGATLYHLLTGSPPTDALTRATALVNGDPDPLRPASELNPRVPTEVADVLSRALQQSAARRFTSAEEMRAALREAAKFVEETEQDALVAGARADALASGNAFASEQETRLMQGEVGGMTSPLAARAKGTEAVGSQNAATFVGAQAAGNETAGVVGNETAGVVGNETAGVAKDATQISSHAKRDDKSVVTRVRIIDNPSPSRSGSRRTLGLAAGVLIVALITAAVYSLTNDDAPVSPASQPTPQVTGQPAPSSPQPSAEAGQEAATPSPTREATPAESRPAPAPTVRNEKPQEQTPPVVEVKPPVPPAPVGHPESDAQAEAEADAIFRNRDWVNNPPTDEEMRRWSEQFPRRARMIQQRIQKQNEQRRRNNRRLPAPRPPDQRPPP